MFVADLELCRKLYELSGWETDDWYDLDENGQPYHELATAEDKSIGDDNQYLPAYDLGYILRKLPLSKSPNSTATLTLFGTTYGKWKACYATSQQSFEADTPENAAVQLAIELFEQGVLTREEV